jgi:hypothetical protein
LTVSAVANDRGARTGNPGGTVMTSEEWQRYQAVQAEFRKFVKEGKEFIAVLRASAKEGADRRRLVMRSASNPSAN